jgi:quercetin dioxygenase-like cupin family protein
MKLFRSSEVPGELQHRPLFKGGDSVMQLLLARDPNQDFFSCIRSWPPGVRACFHAHSSDQMLIITEGSGVVATEDGQKTVGVGDVVLIPAEEKHWHGATDESAFAYIQVQAGESQTTQLED